MTNHPEAKTADTEAFGSYCPVFAGPGIYCAPSQFEAMFLSMAHGDEELNRTLDTIRGYFGNIDMEEKNFTTASSCAMATPREAARQRQPRQRRRCSEQGSR